MSKVIRGFGVLSAAKIGGILYAGIGLVAGVIVALISLVGGFAGMATDAGGASGVIGMVMGVGAIIALPVFYGVVGFLAMALSALLFNIGARVTGGLEVDMD